jgi:hypothetical protein
MLNLLQRPIGFSRYYLTFNLFPSQKIYFLGPNRSVVNKTRFLNWLEIWISPRVAGSGKVAVQEVCGE